jgi:hypothetical protein
MRYLLRKQKKWTAEKGPERTKWDASPHRDTGTAHVESVAEVPTVFNRGRFVCSSFQPFIEHPSSSKPPSDVREKDPFTPVWVSTQKRKEGIADKSIFSSPVMCIVWQEGIKLAGGGQTTSSHRYYTNILANAFHCRVWSGTAMSKHHTMEAHAWSGEAEYVLHLRIR